MLECCFFVPKYYAIFNILEKDPSEILDIKSYAYSPKSCFKYSTQVCTPNGNKV